MYLIEQHTPLSTIHTVQYIIETRHWADDRSSCSWPTAIVNVSYLPKARSEIIMICQNIFISWSSSYFKALTVTLPLPLTLLVPVPKIPPGVAVLRGGAGQRRGQAVSHCPQHNRDTELSPPSQQQVRVASTSSGVLSELTPWQVGTY